MNGGHHVQTRSPRPSGFNGDKKVPEGVRQIPSVVFLKVNDLTVFKDNSPPPISIPDNQ
jgi:hypothetical protein